LLASTRKKLILAYSLRLNSTNKYILTAVANNQLDIILAPYGFGGTDNMAQEGAHALFGDGELVKRLGAIGYECNEIQPPSLGPFEIQEESGRIRNLEAILTINNWLSESIKNSLSRNHFPIMLGGDGSLVLGTISGLIEFYRDPGKLGIIWLTNHMQNSSPRVTKSWNANRMIFTALTFEQEAKHADFIALMKFRSLGTPIINKNQIVHIGINHKSAQEKAEHKYFTMHDIDDQGLEKILDESFKHLSHCKHIHVIWDLNSLDISGVSNFALGQLSYREALKAARQINQKLRHNKTLCSIDIVEHCPSREAWDKRGEGAAWMADILCNIFGENIFNAARKY
jgi:arginase